MLCGDVRSAIILMDQRLEEAEKAARANRLARDISRGSKATVRKRLCRMLYGLGHSLVAAGRYLERNDLSEQSL
jgi:hypothetical protein